MDNNVSRVGESTEPSALNVPNALTVIRLILVPVFLWLCWRGYFADDATWAATWWAFGVFAFAAVTDKVDGYIARSRNLVTNFGKIADPIADKALTLSAFVVLSLIEILPWWFTLLIAIRELGITVLRSILLRRGIVVAASTGGKLKTVLQMGALGLLFIPWYHLALLYPGGLTFFTVMTYAGLVIAGVALAITLWSGAEYLIAGIRLWKEAGESGEAVDSDESAEAEEVAGAEELDDAQELAPAEELSGGSDPADPEESLESVADEGPFVGADTESDGEAQEAAEEPDAADENELPFLTRMERRRREGR
ncbi:CDP-diacylglycerol--glycerol-3-phosphate 3-phosphatidyltransferase [Schaalia sp. ZJ1691]|uniref:CDP-diacylglycerol--glycerol-3-phosphate 3-phosphatidyltransferase n=1 Tax=Schaalia sp. ZJ1691 TaxID=2709404 RepID=UPI0013EBB398|nr:CDP-diacylglycerol--glycerol-3-phosphate 3-phosphatidyltransferase [Schaalia sp. ZJ1691]